MPSQTFQYRLLYIAESSVSSGRGEPASLLRSEAAVNNRSDNRSWNCYARLQCEILAFTMCSNAFLTPRGRPSSITPCHISRVKPLRTQWGCALLSSLQDLILLSLRVGWCCLANLVLWMSGYHTISPFYRRHVSIRLISMWAPILSPLFPG